MNGDDGVGAIVFAAKHLLGFRRFDLAFEFGEAALEVAGDVLTGASPLNQHREVVAAPLQRLTQGLVVFETPPALHDFLRPGLVAPEPGLPYLAFDLGELVPEASVVKDTSGVPPRAGSDPHAF
jgi:hypothetical protein